MKVRSGGFNKRGNSSKPLVGNRIPLYMTQFGFFPVNDHGNNFTQENFFKHKGTGGQYSINQRKSRGSHGNRRRKNRVDIENFLVQKSQTFNKNQGSSVTEKYEQLQSDNRNLTHKYDKFATVVETRPSKNSKSKESNNKKKFMNRFMSKKNIRESESYENYEAEASYLMDQAFKNDKMLRKSMQSNKKRPVIPAANEIFGEVLDSNEQSTGLLNQDENNQKHGKIEKTQTFRIKKRKDMTYKTGKQSSPKMAVDEYGKFLRISSNDGNDVQEDEESHNPSKVRKSKTQIGRSQGRALSLGTKQRARLKNGIKEFRRGIKARFSSNTENYINGKSKNSTANKMRFAKTGGFQGGRHNVHKWGNSKQGYDDFDPLAMKMKMKKSNEHSLEAKLFQKYNIPGQEKERSSGSYNKLENNFMRKTTNNFAYSRNQLESERKDTKNSQDLDQSRRKNRNYEKPWLMNANKHENNGSRKGRLAKTYTSGFRRTSTTNKKEELSSHREKDFINFDKYRQDIGKILNSGGNINDARTETIKPKMSKTQQNFHKISEPSTNYRTEPNAEQGRYTKRAASSTNRKGKVRRLNNYEIGEILGKGSYAVVHLGVDMRNQSKWAIKSYEKSKLNNKTRRTIVEREIQVLAFCNHPQIVKLQKTIHTKNHIHLVMELANGVMLSKYAKSRPNKRLDEIDAAYIFKQILKSIDYCHKNLIFHRDLKTENIMVDKYRRVKLIDFGFSLRQRSLGKLSLFCGTPNYMSPEVVLRKEYYGGPNDVWALGVMLFRICAGRFPFVGKDNKSLNRKIVNMEYQFSSSFSEQLKDLIKMIFQYDPKMRPSCQKILDHPWLYDIN